MRTDLIRDQLRDAWKEEARTGAFASLVRQQLVEAGTGTVPEDSVIVRGILEGWRLQLANVADLIDALREAATSAGVASAVEPVLRAAEDYFLVADDLLPDHHGILGLLDDMYLALSLIQRLCEQHRDSTGRTLMDVDLRESIASARGLFRGARLAALDEQILAAMRRPEVARSLEQLARFGGVLCPQKRVLRA